MNRKPMLIMILTIFLLGLLGAVSKIQKVEASETIYIMADGSIAPSSAPITREGNIYTFTEDIVNNSIVVKRENVVIDGAEHKLQGTGIYSEGSGLYLNNVTRVTIKRVKISEFYWGVQMFLCSDCALLENEMSNNGYGIYPNRCNNSLIARNKVANNEGGGIYLTNSFNFSIEENMVTSNRFYGIRLTNSHNCTLIENVIADNRGDGIHLVLSNNNAVYHNNFVNNTRQASTEDEVTDNAWDDGYPSGGNYWSNYTGSDIDYDGIADSWYEIDADNIDNYPLMGMFSSFNTSYGYAVSFVSTSSISNFSFNLNNTEAHPLEAILTFNVTGETGTKGFLRVCIPKILINGSYVVKFDGEVITNTTYPQVKEMPCSDETYEYLYINYTHSEHTVEISGTTTVSEFPSFPILPLFIIAALLTAIIVTLLILIIYKRKRKI
jgi:parallel beta-helix repeat protein